MRCYESVMKCCTYDRNLNSEVYECCTYEVYECCTYEVYECADALQKT